MLVRVVCTGCLAQWDLTECCFSWQRRRIKKHITGTTRTQTHTGSKHLVLACLTTTASQTLGRASGASNQTGAQTKTPSSFLDTGTAIRDLQPRCRFDDSHRCPSCRIAVVSAGGFVSEACSQKMKNTWPAIASTESVTNQNFYHLV